MVWNNRPGFEATPDGAINISNASTPAWYQIDVTDMTKAWYNGSMPNYGTFLQITGDGTAVVNFDSRNSANASARPKLAINYTDTYRPRTYAKGGSARRLNAKQAKNYLNRYRKYRSIARRVRSAKSRSRYSTGCKKVLKTLSFS